MPLLLLRWVPYILFMMAFAFCGLALTVGEEYGGQPVVLTGGTSSGEYTVKIADARLRSADVPQISREIDSCLREITTRMSVNEPGSEVAWLNSFYSTDPVVVSSNLAFVVSFALQLAESSNGAFDPTIEPLLNLWGLGWAPVSEEPTVKTIEETKKYVGYQYLIWNGDGRIRKKNPSVHLDLGGVLSGYAADRIAQILMSRSISNYLVQVGDEFTAKGNCWGREWQVAVEGPVMDSSITDKEFSMIKIRDFSLATTGDYERYWRGKDGKYYSPFIDPASGRPVEQSLATVMVVAPDCITADGLATTLFIMGWQRGLEFLKKYPQVDALFILRLPDGSFSHVATENFYRHTAYTQAAKDKFN